MRLRNNAPMSLHDSQKLKELAKAFNASTCLTSNVLGETLLDVIKQADENNQNRLDAVMFSLAEMEQSIRDFRKKLDGFIH